MKNIQNLPDSKNEFWEGEVNVNSAPTRVKLCAIHLGKEWVTHSGYIDNKDGTFSCEFCPWGGRLPGYMRVLDGKVIDLRTL